MPQNAWSNKDERQYEHIKESLRERGRAPSRVEEIAARTVNEQRRKEGRTRNRRTSGTGNPTAPLESRTRQQLLNRAKELGIVGRHSMRKGELVGAIREENR